LVPTNYNFLRLFRHHQDLNETTANPHHSEHLHRSINPALNFCP